MTTPSVMDPRARANYYPKAILWMGIILIFLNLYANGGWSYIWSSMTTRAT